MKDFDLQDYDLKKVRLRLSASDGSRFIVDVSVSGFEFYSDESSAGRSHSLPVHKSVDEIWNWVKDEGARVPLYERAAVKKKRESKP